MVINNLRNVDSIGRIGQQPAEVRKPARLDGRISSRCCATGWMNFRGKVLKACPRQDDRKGISLSSRQIDRLNAALKAERKD